MNGSSVGAVRESETVNAYLEAWRTRQHDHEPTVSDHALAAFLTSCDIGHVILDRAAGASDVELRMIGRSRGAA